MNDASRALLDHARNAGAVGIGTVFVLRGLKQFSDFAAYGSALQRLDDAINGIHELASQHYEGGANGSAEHVAEVPPERDVEGRKAWLRKTWEPRQKGEADRARDVLIKWYGEEKGKAVKLAETFEICEYGAQPSDDEVRRLFPFLKK